MEGFDPYEFVETWNPEEQPSPPQMPPAPFMSWDQFRLEHLANMQCIVGARQQLEDLDLNQGAQPVNDPRFMGGAMYPEDMKIDGTKEEESDSEFEQNGQVFYFFVRYLHSQLSPVIDAQFSPPREHHSPAPAPREDDPTPEARERREALRQTLRTATAGRVELADLEASQALSDLNANTEFEPGDHDNFTNLGTKWVAKRLEFDVNVDGCKRYEQWLYNEMSKWFRRVMSSGNQTSIAARVVEDGRYTWVLWKQSAFKEMFKSQTVLTLSPEDWETYHSWEECQKAELAGQGEFILANKRIKKPKRTEEAPPLNPDTNQPRVFAPPRLCVSHQTLADIYLNYPLALPVARVVYNPRPSHFIKASNPAVEINMYPGMRWTREEVYDCRDWARCNMLINHMRFALTDNFAQFEYLVKYMAHIVQRPWEKPDVTIMMVGPPGVCKTRTFEGTLGIILGSNYTTLHGSDQVLGSWNHLSVNKLVVLCDEFKVNDPKSLNMLKNIVTGRYLHVKRKFQDEQLMENVMRMIMATNDTDNPLALAKDDRRVFVVYCCHQALLTSKWYKDMVDIEDKDSLRGYYDFIMEILYQDDFLGLKSWYNLLLNIDIENWNPSNYPLTRISVKAKVNSLPQYVRWWLDCVVREDYTAEYRILASKRKAERERDPSLAAEPAEYKYKWEKEVPMQVFFGSYIEAGKGDWGLITSQSTFLERLLPYLPPEVNISAERIADSVTYKIKMPSVIACREFLCEKIPGLNEHFEMAAPDRIRRPAGRPAPQGQGQINLDTVKEAKLDPKVENLQGIRDFEFTEAYRVVLNMTKGGIKDPLLCRAKDPDAHNSFFNPEQAKRFKDLFKIKPVEEDSA
jgi:hypothetical protein